MRRIYLDNAATSWPKPPEVLQAINEFYNVLGSASGRGTQSSEYSSDHLVRQCRSQLSTFLGAAANDQLVFAFNGTDALNLGLWGALQAGDHVVTTCIEHNSVIRPLNSMAANCGITFTQVDCQDDGAVTVESIQNAINESTRLVAICHASNVTGVVQDVAAIGQLCRERNLIFLLDAAQTVGHLEIDFREMGCDLLAAPGHKGLLGPLGTGLLLISERVSDQMKSWRPGGTGTSSEQTEQPRQYPARLESGNLNVGGIAGLRAGLEFVQQVGLSRIAAKSKSDLQQIRDGLSAIGRIRMVGAHPQSAAGRDSIGVLSFELKDMDPREVAMILDTSFGIQTRAGLHCAPGIHRHFGTYDRGGTIRVSPNWFTEQPDIQNFLQAIAEIAESF